ncbi:MAG: retroviral-like aspartic protease, partial [bacterium]|nr:retroviral-like aspartic protease [bacterium]
MYFPYYDGENFRVPCEVEGLSAMAVVDTGAQTSLISSDMKLRINEKHPDFQWFEMKEPPVVRGLQEEPLKLEPFTAHIIIRTCGREICGPVNIDPSNTFDVLLGIPAIKALGIELRIKQEYELRPTYGPIKYALCNEEERTASAQVTALGGAAVYRGETVPPDAEEWVTVSSDAPITRTELKSSYAGSAPCLKKRKHVKFAEDAGLLGTTRQRVCTRGRSTSFPAEGSTTLRLRVRGGRPQTDALMVLNKEFAKRGLTMVDAIVRLQPRKMIKVTITNPTKEDIILDRDVQIGHLEAVDMLTVNEAVDDIMRRTQEGPTIGMAQATPEELYDRLEKVKA